MKINKVLLGLFAGVIALTGGSARAQFYEIGPANIGGHISSIVVDQTASRSTVYAGSISGGLYVRSADTNVLGRLYSNVNDEQLYRSLINNSDLWHLVRYIDSTTGFEEVLPISAMVQGPDGIIYIGTGDNTYPLGTTYRKMSSKGRGIYRYNPANGSFKLIPFTSPVQNELFGAVRAIDYYYADGKLYMYAATNTGLYRWVIENESDWTSNAVPVFQGSVDQLIIVRNLNMAYFTIGNQLYKISDLTRNGYNPINISSSNSAFGGKNTAIKLAVAPSDNSYLYAMVIDSTGLMENVYLTTNGQVWTPLATTSVMPLTYNSGLACGTIIVDPVNPKRIYLAGTNIWTGEGFLEGANYQWIRNSYSEYELNRGNYMSGVFNTSIYVHSGIHKIIPVRNDEPVVMYGDTIEYTYYIATDGGIFSTSTDFNSYDNINRGMNNVQINSVAVSPDGSIVSGANNNACPFIEARLAHNGGNPILSWYDDGSMGNINHDATIIWTGNGGKVAASAFQQISVQNRRNIFVSSANGNIGRSFADYMDYTNNQTWTIGNSFLRNDVVGGPTIGSISLWESCNDTYYKDSIKVAFDLNGYFIKGNGDTVQITSPTQKIPAGATGTFLSKNNSDYPFTHTFTAEEVGSGNNQKTVADSFMVKNPVISRMLAVVNTSATQSSVIYSWTANDFSKIYDELIDADRDLDPDVKAALKEKFMWWSPIFTVKHNPSLNNLNVYPRDAVMSRDGRFAYVSTYDDSCHRSQLFRVNGFDKVNFNLYPETVQRDINASSDTNDRKLRETKFFRNNDVTNDWFNRPISSIAVDPRPGVDRIVLTFEDYSEAYTNVLVINNASTESWTSNTVQLPITDHVGIPAYCAMIEDSTGNIYVGTSDGVFIYSNTENAWHQYEHLRGVPVTSIVQQTNKFSVKRATTHTGITENKYLFAKTKWPRAIYFGTYGRGIFMDMTYVTDTINEVSDPEDYNPVNIPTVTSTGDNSVSVYPNPVMGEANLNLIAVESGNAMLRIYDLNGRMVVERNLGYAVEGSQLYTIGTEGMAKGMYLVNVIIGGHTAATKMIVR